MCDCRDDEEDDNGGERFFCYFHPREMVIGVCAFCLHERLSAIASSQKKTKHHFHHTFCSLKKVFALTRFVDRVESNFKQHKKSEDSDACSSSLCSQEDSFISIKFEANGVASWDKEKIPKIPLNPQCDKSWSHGERNKVKKIVLEHLKPRGALSWRRRIGRFFSLFRWKKPKRENRCKRTKVEGSKARFGWIRRLGNRSTNE